VARWENTNEYGPEALMPDVRLHTEALCRPLPERIDEGRQNEEIAIHPTQ
jgi:hypothetical protein